MRAEKNGFNLAAKVGKFPHHLAVDRVKVVDREKMPTKAGLIAGDGQAKTSLIQACQGFQTPGNRQPLFDRFYKVVRVVVDNAITVKNNEFHELTARGWMARGDKTKQRSIDRLKPRDVSNTEKEGFEAGKQGQAVGADLHVISHDHYLIKEGVNLWSHAGKQL